MTLHGKSIIAGEPLAASARTFHAVSPLASERLEPAFHEVGGDEVDRALAQAEEAFAVFGRAPAETRAAFLEKIAEPVRSLVRPENPLFFSSSFAGRFSAQLERERKRERDRERERERGRIGLLLPINW